jgi:hypothetical protein
MRPQTAGWKGKEAGGGGLKKPDAPSWYDDLSQTDIEMVQHCEDEFKRSDIQSPESQKSRFSSQELARNPNFLALDYCLALGS